MWLAMTFGFFVIWEFLFLETNVESWLLCSLGWFLVGAREHRSGERSLQLRVFGREHLCQTSRESLGSSIRSWSDSCEGALGSRPSLVIRFPRRRGGSSSRLEWNFKKNELVLAVGLPLLGVWWDHHSLRVWPWLCLCGPPGYRWSEPGGSLMPSGA